MDAILNVLVMAIQFLQGVPSVGPVLIKVLAVVAVLSGVISAVAALMHAIIGVLAALAMIPGMSGLQAVADKLKVADDAAEGFIKQWILPILDRLSFIAIPKK